MSLRIFIMLNKLIPTILIFTLVITTMVGVFSIQEPVFADSLDKQEKALREQLEKLEEEAAVLEASLQKKKQNSASIERDVNILDDEVKRAELEIQKKNLEIRDLNSTIALKEQTISELDAKLDRAREDLVILIKQINETDLITLPEIILSNKTLSDFFIEFDSYKLAQNQLFVNIDML